MSNHVNRPLNVTEAANALGLSVHTVRAWISQRRLSHIRLGRAVRVLPEEIERLLRSAAVPALAWDGLNQVAVTESGRSGDATGPPNNG
jgi:excisionase family DNA binding protein